MYTIIETIRQMADNPAQRPSEARNIPARITPFTLNDIEAICAALGEDLEHFFVTAASHAKNGRNL